MGCTRYNAYVCVLKENIGGLIFKRSLPKISVLQYSKLFYTVELQWLEHLWDHENYFETGVVRAS